MRVLVLDTIHGGKEIAQALAERGHAVDMVDVYRGQEGISPSIALRGEYDLVVAPVHLDPSHPLLRDLHAPVISHHQAVKWILGKDAPPLLVEVTGARGKTTTACALAHVLRGPGILHTSRGTVLLPEGQVVGRGGITPAALIGPALLARSQDRWLVAEISLGFIGLGRLGILTSGETYRFAGGKRDALTEKLRSGDALPAVVTPPGTGEAWNRVPANRIATASGRTCRYSWEGIEGSYENPLLGTGAYCEPLLLATAAACILGIDPSPLSDFSPLEGRKVVSREGDLLVVDDSNSGTCGKTARDAISIARAIGGKDAPLTLVIGKERGAICEGFPPGEIASVAREESPDRIVLVGDYDPSTVAPHAGGGVRVAGTLAEGREIAMQSPAGSIVVLAVKTWR
ncbi:MAG: coenzyme F430 synthase [Methanolinea sp.]